MKRAQEGKKLEYNMIADPQAVLLVAQELACNYKFEWFVYLPNMLASTWGKDSDQSFKITTEKKI